MLDPRSPDFACTPSSATRSVFAYAPRDARAAAQRPLVTITTAFFNTNPVFRETAACVLNQSLQAWEWVIVNDGSTDPTSLAMLDEFRAIDPRIRVVDHDRNRGLSAARNTGFRSARSPYVYQLDSDDLIEPTAVEKCLWYIHTRPDAAFVTSYVVGFGAQQYLWTKGFHNRETFLQENVATPMGIMRRDLIDRVGEYDETNRGGMEDWEYWLRCAAQGAWGGTIPEYLAWYRRRDQHWDAWANMRVEERRREFHEGLLAKYRDQLEGRFPALCEREHRAFDDIRIDPGIENPLAKKAKRLLLICPWLTMGGADKFNVAMTRELVERGWEVTICTTLAGDNSWLPEFTKWTPDVFVAPHFLHPTDIPAFLRYMIESRSPDVVMVSNSELGYHVLPYLRSHCPEPAYVDLSHMEEPWWKNGGHPRYGLGAQPLLDLNIVVSEHLKNWQVERGAEADRVEVCYVSTCEDSNHWRRDASDRRMVRSGMEIPDGHAVILYAGRIVQQKQPRVMARAMRELAAANEPFVCLVAGDGPDMGWLRWFVQENNLSDRVRLLGALPHHEMKELMSAADIFFLPSLWEGIAISIYEAMSMELAVVGAAVGGQAELVTPECGRLIPRGTEDEEVLNYTAALREVIADPTARRTMGAAARQRIRSGFEPRHMGARLEEIFARAQDLARTNPRAAVDRAFACECAIRGVEYLRTWDAAEANHHAREALWRDREAIRQERDALLAERAELQSRLALNGHHNGHALVDPRVVAEQIIRENMRYVAVDRINGALKSIRVHGALKAITTRVLGNRRPPDQHV